MTIEVLKIELTKLTRLERLEFLQFLAGPLASKEKIEPLSEAQQKPLLTRRDELISGKRTRYQPKM